VSLPSRVAAGTLNSDEARVGCRLVEAWCRTMRKSLDVISTALVAIAAAFFLWTQVETRWMRPRNDGKPQNVDGLAIDASVVRHSKGTASIALVEFTDYECRFCSRHALQTTPDIDKQLVETGALRHIVFNFPLEALHPKVRKAHEAAECAARQGRYWQMHQRLFGGSPFALDDLLKLGEALGLDNVAFKQCLAGEAADVVTADLNEGRRLGVTSTPTFFVGVVQPDGSIQLVKRILGAKPFEDFRKTVEAVATASGRKQG
jgi:protein-disulfide isomerase